jgi:hypothetical protein
MTSFTFSSPFEKMSSFTADFHLFIRPSVGTFGFYLLSYPLICRRSSAQA